MQRYDNQLPNRRKVLRAGIILAGLGVLSACAGRDAVGTPSMRFVYPDWQGARIQDNPVPVRVQVENYKPASDVYRTQQVPMQVVFFIDTSADAVADGQPVPKDPKKFVPAAAPSYTAQVIEFAPGVHTVTAVMTDGQGNKVSEPPPVSITMLVQPGGLSVR